MYRPLRSPFSLLHWKPAGFVAAALLIGMGFVFDGASSRVHAEYADVVLNNTSEDAGMRPVIYPHWFHRIRFRCKVCHSEFGFKMRVGANKITMNDINEGKFCGMCHNSDIAWGLENCDLCHSGKPGLKTKIQGGHQTLGPGRW